MKGLFLVTSIIFLLVLDASNCWAQDFTVKTTSQKVVIDKTTYDGFSATVDFPMKEMKKEFKLFAKSFAKYNAGNKYSRIEIKPESKEKDASLFLYVTFEDNAGKTKINLVLNATDMSESDRKSFAQLPNNTLKEFQIYYYQKWLQNRIVLLESHVANLGKKEMAMMKKQGRLQKKQSDTNAPTLTEIKNELAKLKSEQKRTQAQIDSLKGKFKDIK